MGGLAMFWICWKALAAKIDASLDLLVERGLVDYDERTGIYRAVT